MPITPADYRGREPAFIKHTLLRGYIEKLFMIIGQHERRICYVDCFAGPWQEQGDDLHDTSVGIALNIMKGCKQDLASLSKDVHFRALFIEKDPAAHTKLKKFLLREEWSQLETEALPGDCYDLRSDIYSWCDDGSFAFFFIDPKGWKDVDVDTLRPLLERDKSEYLINFMLDFIRRNYTQAKWEQHMRAIFGAVPDTSGMSPDEREAVLIQLYQQHLKTGLPRRQRKPRSTCVRVLYPDKDRTKYYLVYLTRNPLGIIEFTEKSERIDVVQRQVRAEAKRDRRIQQTGQMELWEPEALADATTESIDLEGAKQYWLSVLPNEPKRIGVEQMADMIEKTGWFISNFQMALAELIAEKRVRNLDTTRRRPKNIVDFRRDRNRGEHLQKLES